MIGTFGIKEAAAAEAAEEGEAGFQLLVVNFAGTTVTLDGCLVSDTIDAVAGAFATKLDLPKRIVRLMLEGTQLDAEGTLAHYQITAGCQLHALLRLRGGVPPGDDQREAAAEERNAVSDMAKVPARRLHRVKLAPRAAPASPPPSPVVAAVGA